MPPHTIRLSDLYRRRRPTRSSLIVSAMFVLALVLGNVVTASASSSSISWRGDYETGDFNQWSLGVQTKDPSRATIVTSVAGGAPRQGQYAARIEVDAGDSQVAGSGQGERTEALLGSAITGASEGADQWWAWSTYFPSDFTTGLGMWNFFTQFHHTGSSGQSNIEFTVKDNSSLVLISNSGDSAQPTEHDYSLSPLLRGRWSDFVFHVRWSSDPSVGFIEAYVNGVQVVPHTATATMYPGQSVYLKQGFYRAACSCNSVLYQDGMRRGSSYSDVVSEFPSGTWPSSPGGSTPAPPPPVTTTTPPPPVPTTTTTVTIPTPTTTTTATTTKTTTPTTTTTATTAKTATTTKATTAPAGAAQAPPSAAVAGSPAAPNAGPTPDKAPAASRGVEWNGRRYASAKTLRSAFAQRTGVSWEAFLELHPAAAAELKLVKVTYGSTFYTQQALARWLAAHHQSVSGWAAAHAAASAALAGQPADTPASERLTLSANPKLRGSRTLEVRGHAFPGARGQIVVRAGSTRLGAVGVVIDYAGSIDGLVKLNAWSGQRRLTLTLTASYPEGPRTASASVKLAPVLRIARSR